MSIYDALSFGRFSLLTIFLGSFERASFFSGNFCYVITSLLSLLKGYIVKLTEAYGPQSFTGTIVNDTCHSFLSR